MYVCMHLDVYIGVYANMFKYTYMAIRALQIAAFKKKLTGIHRYMCLYVYIYMYI
jgi:hypothetical protein